MEFREKHKKLFDLAEIILSYIAIASLVLFVLDGDRTPQWRLFIDHYFKFPVLIFVFAAASGSLLYMRRDSILLFLKTDTFWYSTLLLTALVGLCFKLPMRELIIFLYSLYAILFINQPPAWTTRFNSTHTHKGRLLSEVFNIEGRTPALLALFLLLFVPVLLIFKKNTVAEYIAGYAYYLLVLAIVLQIVEIKLGIDRENQLLMRLKDLLHPLYRKITDSDRWNKRAVVNHSLLIGLKDLLHPLYRKITDSDRWNKRASVLHSCLRGLFTKNKLMYLAVIIVIVASTYTAEQFYWMNVAHKLAGYPEYRSEISLLSNGRDDYTFASDADEITLPVRIRHPFSKPQLWHKNAVKIGILWCSFDDSGHIKERLFEDYQPLTRDLIVGESADMELKVKRPAIPYGRDYEVWVGLVTDDNVWFLNKGDSVLKVHVHLTHLPAQKTIAYESRILDQLHRKLEEGWSVQLSTFRNSYHSKIELLKGDILTAPGTCKIAVTNMGNIPWPIHSSNPVGLGVVWMKKIEEAGKTRYIHLAEEIQDLTDVVFPNEKITLRVYCDPLKVPEANEIWLGMVHEGKTWFYERGDTVLKITKKNDEDKLIAQQLIDIREKNDLIARELSKSGIEKGHVLAKRYDAGHYDAVKLPDSYRSDIRLLNYRHADILLNEGRGLPLELKVTNTGEVIWSPSGEHAVNLGILWFNKSDAINKTIIDSAKRIDEERCYFPFTIIKDMTVRMKCQTGQWVPHGNYEVWIGPVQEGVTWFYEKGDNVLKLNVRVR